MFINLNLIVTSFGVLGNSGKGDRSSEIVEAELPSLSSGDAGAVFTSCI
ncbi:hypothetical protein [Tychonema sp. BBK16]|nr:hypothetical protein [Tychonema sp. BBK16]MCF6372791.1 hypothetical protein [Tychonema sp. BBK16]